MITNTWICVLVCHCTETKGKFMFIFWNILIICKIIIVVILRLSPIFASRINKKIEQNCYWCIYARHRTALPFTQTTLTFCRAVDLKFAKKICLFYWVRMVVYIQQRLYLIIFRQLTPPLPILNYTYIHKMAHAHLTCASLLSTVG